MQGPQAQGVAGLAAPLGIPTLRPEASPCPGHPRTSPGLSSAPRPLPRSRLERVLGWAGSPAFSPSSVPGAAVCCQAREADNRPGGVRKGPRPAEGEAGRRTPALQPPRPGPRHGGRTTAGPGAARSPGSVTWHPVPVGAGAGSLLSQLDSNPTVFAAHWEPGHRGSGANGRSSEEPGV